MFKKFLRQLRMFRLHHGMSLCFGIPLLVAVYWAVLVEPATFRERDRTVEIAGLAPELDGFTIAVVSDLHYNWLRKEKEDEYTESINRRSPDLIVLLGDFVNSPPRELDPSTDKLEAWLRTLEARHGLCAVLGNHDVEYDRARGGVLSGDLSADPSNPAGLKYRPTPLADDIQRYGHCRVLCNETLRIGPERGGLNLIGIDYRNPSSDVSLDVCRKLIRPECVNILLTHTPDIFPELPSAIALTLAGHTHGGQLALPFCGPLIRYSRYGRKLIYGHVREKDGRQLIVTAGLGAGHDVRFCVPPEIVFIKLVAK